MSDWSSDQYLKFKAQRTQPAIDLLKRISELMPGIALDIGCGPGNSTEILQKAFPAARVLGVDSSENMIAKARESYSEIDFQLCDVTRELEKLPDDCGLIFSNACLQWVPNHEQLIPALMEKLEEGGVLAVQIPINGEEPLFQIMGEIVADPKWGFEELDVEANGTLEPAAYYDILSRCANCFDIWETVYYHSMPTYRAMVEWIKGTRLRPYLNALSPEKAAQLEEEILQAAKKVYRAQENGEIIFRFRRLFFTAVR